VTSQNKRDMVYGRRGGGWVDGAGATTDGPGCDVCGAPMLAGQKRRHAMCGPRCPTCGHPEDLIANVAKHRAEHAEAAR